MSDDAKREAVKWEFEDPSGFSALVFETSLSRSELSQLQRTRAGEHYAQYKGRLDVAELVNIAKSKGIVFRGNSGVTFVTDLNGKVIRSDVIRRNDEYFIESILIVNEQLDLAVQQENIASTRRLALELGALCAEWGLIRRNRKNAVRGAKQAAGSKKDENGWRADNNSWQKQEAAKRRRRILELDDELQERGMLSATKREGEIRKTLKREGLCQAVHPATGEIREFKFGKRYISGALKLAREERAATQAVGSR